MLQKLDLKLSVDADLFVKKILNLKVRKRLIVYRALDHGERQLLN